MEDYTTNAHVLPDASTSRFSVQMEQAPLTTFQLHGNILIQQKLIMDKLSEEYRQFIQDIFNAITLDILFHMSG
jgi:hypothetical protein